MSEQPSSNVRVPARRKVSGRSYQAAIVKCEEQRLEIERLQQEVNELELTHRVKDNKDLAARDLAELRPCYSVTGLETFIAKHFPALELRERTAHEPCDALALATRFHETYERLAPSFGYETRPDTKTFDPESKNGRLMVAVCREIGAALPPLSLPALVDQYVRHLNPGRPPGGIVETVLNGFVKWAESTGTTKEAGQ